MGNCEIKKGKSNARSGNLPKKSKISGTMKKSIILFSLLGVVSAFLTFLTVSIKESFGGSVPVYNNFLFWDWNVFFAYVIGLVLTPLITVYVIEKRKQVFGK